MDVKENIMAIAVVNLNTEELQLWVYEKPNKLKIINVKKIDGKI